MEKASYHPVQQSDTYIEVVLPLAIPKPYTYLVPNHLIEEIQFGVRAEVQFGKSKYYTGIVVDVQTTFSGTHTPKSITAVLDRHPIITQKQFELWKWISKYYCCTLGEIMHAALPAHLKLTSETILLLNPAFNGDYSLLDDKAYMIAEALQIQNQITIDDARKILDQKTIYPTIKKLLDHQVLFIQETLKEKYKPKKVICVRLHSNYAAPGKFSDAFERTKNAPKQTETLMAFIQLNKQLEVIQKQDLYNLTDTNSAIIKALVEKGIFELYEKPVSRLAQYEEATINAHQLSEQQVGALNTIKQQFEQKEVVLLHGVTGSGKTRVYIELIQQYLSTNQQILYLLPEIALTTQIIERLQKIFGNDIGIYHSRMTNDERVEVWQSALNGKKIILGARSALFLPFQNLGLVIVDEAHDPSFKQNDPAPRYQGRDTAIYLANIFKAKVLLGTATPSLESYFNAKSGKYGLVEMPIRFGHIQMPEVIIADAKQELKHRKLQAHFTSVLIEELKGTLERGEQAILFQNRRGFAPYYQCTVCAWHSACIHCDVSLTYHKIHNNLKCHYCGYSTQLPVSCPECGSKKLTVKGFGTEKIEDDLQIYFPEAKIGRMDLETVRAKNAYSKIINDFEEKRIQILVGTQMVTKGLDFDNVGLVGVLSADQLLQFPDFRAAERAFQLMTQVSGRAGRKKKRGKVIIQAFNTSHPVLEDVIQNDFTGLYEREVQERQSFQYPPFFRLIQITLKHKKPEVLNQGAKIFAHYLQGTLGKRMLGPAVPYISRIRGYYLLQILIKLERNKHIIEKTKQLILDATDEVHSKKGLSGVRVNVDVDPY